MPYSISEFHRRGAARTMFFMAHNTNGQPLSPLVGVTGRLSKDGAAFATCTNLPTSIGNGLHSIALTAAETDADTLGIVFTATSTGYAPASIVSSAFLELSKVSLIGTTGQNVPVVNILSPCTGNIPVVRIQSTPTGGGSALELATANYLEYSLELTHANATGQCIKFGGYLPEPTMPIDKDTWTIMDALGFIAATMANRTTLNKDTLTHTLYKRDNSSTMVARSVSDDGTTQSMSATD